MNENALRRIRIPADDSRLCANWGAVHAFNRVTSNRNEQKKMKTLISSTYRSPLRCGFFTLVIALICFGLSPTAKALLPPPAPDGAYPGVNTAEGEGALFSLTTGIANTAVGFHALHNDTTGGYNVAIGSSALASNITGQQNMAIGTDALTLSNSNFNLAIGFRVGYLNTTGARLTGIGAAALRNNTTASDNTAIGANALRENTTSEDNVAVGDSALASYNGLNAGIDGFNTALGSIALTSLTSGFQNTAVGRRALENLTTGNNNTSVGWRSGDNLTSAINNVFVGAQAGVGATTGDRNVVVGTGSGSNIGSGTRNIYIGDSVRRPDGLAESRFIRIGDTSFTDYDCFIAGIYNRAVNSALMPHIVIVDSHGKLGTIALPLDAPEVKDPALRPDAPGREKLGMLNLKVDQLQATVARQQKQIEELTAGLQKVSAQLEASKPAPKVVANK